MGSRPISGRKSRPPASAGVPPSLAFPVDHCVQGRSRRIRPPAKYRSVWQLHPRAATGRPLYDVRAARQGKRGTVGGPMEHSSALRTPPVRMPPAPPCRAFQHGGYRKPTAIFCSSQALDFIKTSTSRDRVRAYGIFGGTPRYLAAIKTGRSLAENTGSGLSRRTRATAGCRSIRYAFICPRLACQTAALL